MSDLMSMITEHCIDRLRQGIQCASDLSTLYWQWRRDLGQWQVSLKTLHTCRNFEDIRDWAVQHEHPNWDTTIPP